MRFCLTLFAFTLMVACAACFDVSSSTANRVLVIVDTVDVKRTHAAFFKELASAYELTFKAASDASLELTHFGEFLFDHVLFFAPAANALAGALDSAGEQKARIFFIFFLFFSFFRVFSARVREMTRDSTRPRCGRARAIEWRRFRRLETALLVFSRAFFGGKRRF